MKPIFTQYRSTNLSLLMVAILTPLFCWPVSFSAPLLQSLGIPRYLDIDCRLWSEFYGLAQVAMLLGFVLMMPILRLITAPAKILQVGLMILAAGQLGGLVAPAPGLVVSGFGSGLGLGALYLLLMESSHQNPLRMAAWLAFMGAICLALAPLMTPILGFTQYLFSPSQNAMHATTKALSLLAIPLTLTLAMIGHLRLYPLRQTPSYVEDRFNLVALILPLIGLSLLPALPELNWQPDSVPQAVRTNIQTIATSLVTFGLAALMWHKRQVGHWGLVAGVLVALILLFSQLSPYALFSLSGMVALLLNASLLWIHALLLGLCLSALPYRCRAAGLVVVMMAPKLAMLLWHWCHDPALNWQEILTILAL